MKKNNRLLIVANSARMLAQAARNSGYIPFVIDCYGDVDTQNLAEHACQVESLSIENLHAAIDFFKQQNITKLIYGSGFEAYPDSLFFLAKHFEIMGNSPETFVALHNKMDFFQQLSYLKISFPEVQFSSPNTLEDWLIKPNQSQGGLNIHFLNKTNLNNHGNVYYQRYIHGKSLSVLFLANGKVANIIGFNTQFFTPFKNQPFVFSGIMNYAELPLKKRLIKWIQQLTQLYSLRGLNSLDFIFANHCCYLLEINPRPPASMQLYEADLIHAHIQACAGKWTKRILKSDKTRLYHILYAEQETRIPENMHWTNVCVDIPQNGTTISAGQPICSMIVEPENADLLWAEVAIHTKIILQQLSN